MKVEPTVPLLPCPFCGGEAQCRKSDMGPGLQTSSVRCKTCPGEVARCSLDAEEFWNKRVPAAT